MVLRTIGRRIKYPVVRPKAYISRRKVYFGIFGRKVVWSMLQRDGRVALRAGSSGVEWSKGTFENVC